MFRLEYCVGAIMLLGQNAPVRLEKERLSEIRSEIARIREQNQAYRAIARPSDTDRFAYSARKLRLQNLKAELSVMKRVSEMGSFPRAG
jgi:hypothetical protein